MKTQQILEDVRILEGRMENYPLTWHRHQDLQPYLREYVMLTKDDSYIKKFEARQEKGRNG